MISVRESLKETALRSLCGLVFIVMWLALVFYLEIVVCDNEIAFFARLVSWTGSIHFAHLATMVAIERRVLGKAVPQDEVESDLVAFVVPLCVAALCAALPFALEPAAVWAILRWM